MGLVRAHRSKLEPRFFLYFYLSPDFQEFLRSRTVNGATVDRIALKELPSFPINLPPLREQQAISSLLGALDDKIELNRRMNETLEAMARAIFKDWFVDFGPTRAKMEGRVPYLAPEIWELFPNSFNDEVPIGWNVKQWREISTLEYGKALRGYEVSVGQVPVFGTNGRIGSHDRAIHNRPSTIIGRKGAYRGVHFSSIPFFVIDTAFYLNLDKHFSARWAYYSICNIDINFMDSGSAIPSTSREEFYQLKVVVPPTTLHNRFDDLLLPLWSLQDHIETENENSPPLATFSSPS